MPSPPELLPARMLNEFTYCPRLFYLEWVQKEWAHNRHTVEGVHQHRRVDKRRGEVAKGGDEPWGEVSSVEMSAPNEGLIARMDLVSFEQGRAMPVDTKKGRAPSCPEGAWEPERVQLCAQGLILRENGYECEAGALYFAASRRRVRVHFDEALISRTRHLIKEARRCADAGQVPPPLVDSPKCAGCSLVGICLPDEVHALDGAQGSLDKLGGAGGLRRVAPPSADALPVYVSQYAAKVGKRGDVLEVRHKGEKLGEARLRQTSHLALFGSVSVSAQALKALCSAEVTVAHHSYGGWFYGVTKGHDHRNIDRRLRQFEAARDTGASLTLARRFVKAKIANCRVFLRRNHANVERALLEKLKRQANRALVAKDAATLLGIEGTAARLYFGRFAGMLKGDAAKDFDLQGRNRRPPRDPVNALLSLGYALLVKDMTLTAMAVGFDPYLGFFHKPRYGRPALALDMMEEFRPVIVDSVVITALNNGELTESDFVRRVGAVALTADGRKRFIRAYERRMSTELTHPLFGYRLTYRQLLEVQMRLLDRYLMGEISPFPNFLVR